MIDDDETNFRLTIATVVIIYFVKNSALSFILWFVLCDVSFQP